MGRMENCKEISEILGIDEPDVVLGGGIKTDWIRKMCKALPEDVSIEEDRKIRILKSIFESLNLDWKADYDTDIMDENGKTRGSTMHEEISIEILGWLRQNQVWLEKYENNLYSRIKELYDDSEKYMLDDIDLYLEKELFEKFSTKYTWILSLKPIWKVLDSNDTSIDWSLGESELIGQIIEKLNLNDFESKKYFYEELTQHLDLAITNINKYNESVNAEGGSKKIAHEEWVEMWQLLGNQKEMHVPINAETSTWSINRFRIYAESGKLNTDPWYQRPFVWGNGASQMLINSIMLGIPLPSVILHEVINEKNEKTYEIIDGKQRITTILNFIGKHPTGVSFMKSKLPALQICNEEARKLEDNLLLDIILRNKSPYKDPFKTIKRFRKWKDDKEYGLIDKKIEEAKYLPFKLGPKEFNSESLVDLNGKYYHEMRGKQVKMKGNTVNVEDIFEGDTTNYEIPVILYHSDTTAEQIRGVFNRYNTQGKKLSAEEVNNAVYHELMAMKFVLTMTRVRPERGEEVLPGLYSSTISSESKKLEDLFKSCGINDGRYKWSRYLAFVLGLILNPMAKTKNGSFPTDGVTSVVKKFWESEKEEKRINRENCKHFAELIGNAANSLTYSTLWNLMADYPEFREKKSGSHIWADPTFFSFFIGAILCQISDIKIEEMIEKIEVYEKMEKFITGLETLGKTDANGQWRYYANTIIDFCEIFGLDKNNFVDNRDLCQGNNLLSYLSNYLNK